MDDSENIEQWFQVFEGLETLMEELSLFECVFGEQEPMSASLEAREESDIASS